MIDERARKSTLSQRLIRCLFHDRSSVCGCSTSLLTDCEFLCNQWVTIFFWQDKLSIRNGKLIKQPPQGHLLTSQVQVVFTTSGNFQRDICRFDRPGLFPLLLKPRQISAVVIPGITSFQDSGTGVWNPCGCLSEVLLLVSHPDVSPGGLFARF